VAVIAAGKIVAEGPPGSLAGRDTAATAIRFRLADGEARLPPAIQEAATSANGLFEVRTEDPTRTLYDLTGWALERGIRLEALDVTRPTLEDVYLQLTGGEAGTEG
jgi:ABC-2 type transport system ATP-binding protein